MRELTLYDLDAQLAEPLPDRELMSLLIGSLVTQNAVAVANSGLNNTLQASVFGGNIADSGNVNAAAALNLFQ